MPEVSKIRSDKLLWIPRIMTIILILFFSIFSFDVFSMDGSFLQKIGGFLIHNIPSFLLIIILIVAWKRPPVGGAALLAFGILITFFFRTYDSITSFLLISVTLFINGGLYLLLYLIRETKRKKENKS